MIFLIEDTNNNLFGCYINSKIDKYRHQVNGTWKGERIKDQNIFIFTIRNNGRSNEMIKINIKKEDSNWAFTLYEKDNTALFGIGGGHDIGIYKENYKNQCYCKPETFSYPNRKNNICRWDSKTVIKKVRNEIYIGTLVQGKAENVGVGDEKRQIPTAPDKWIKTEKHFCNDR